MQLCSFKRAGLAVAVLITLSGCATVASQAELEADVDLLSKNRLGGITASVSPPKEVTPRQLIAELLSKPLDQEAAVKIALLNNPSLRVAFAELAISDADRVQASRLPNPHLSLGALREGEVRTINRAIGFDILGLLTLPWRVEWQNQQKELVKLRAAQDVIRVAADTRKAWVNAVAAQQMANYTRDVKTGAEAGAELARRMARVGNWSRQRQAQEQLSLADTTAQLARAELNAKTSRERLIRQMGLWGSQVNFELVDRLPDLPKSPQEITDVEAQAIATRLDVKSATDEAQYVAKSLGYVKTRGFVNALSIEYERNSIFNNGTGSKDTEKGPTLSLEVPIFDWGSARNARAEAVYRQSIARIGEVAGTARSEAREAYYTYRTAYDLAVANRDEVVPLRKFLLDETSLRYNGMFVSVWDLLSEVGKSVTAVSNAVAAQRDFWLTEIDLQTTLTGTSPSGLLGLSANTAMGTDAPKGH